MLAQRVDPEPLDREPSAGRLEVRRGPGPRAYSTVTDFARFLGWSTSVPRASAT